MAAAKLPAFQLDFPTIPGWYGWFLSYLCWCCYRLPERSMGLSGSAPKKQMQITKREKRLGIDRTWLFRVIISFMRYTWGTNHLSLSFEKKSIGTPLLPSYSSHHESSGNTEKSAQATAKDRKERWSFAELCHLNPFGGLSIFLSHGGSPSHGCFTAGWCKGVPPWLDDAALHYVRWILHGDLHAFTTACRIN